MNKLASIFFLQSIRLPTVFPNIITTRDEKKIRRQVGSFYYDYEPGWVLRCGNPPEKTGKPESGLPWDIVHSREKLVKKIMYFQKNVGSKYFVFCHPVNEMVSGGIMLIEGDRVVVESASGGPRELSAFYRGYRNPEQQIVFSPGMFSNNRYGESVLCNRDLFDIRRIERTLNWNDLNAVADPVAVEFSWLKDGRFYVHDLTVVN